MGKRATTSSKPAAKTGAQAPAAPAEQQVILPADSNTDAAALDAAPTSGAAQQSAQAPGADAALTTLDLAASTTGQDAHLVSEGSAAAPKAPATVPVVIICGDLNVSLLADLRDDGVYVVELKSLDLFCADLASRTAQLEEAFGKAPVTASALSEDVEGLFIRSVSPQGFRRAGMRFTPEGHGIALSALTEAQIQALLDDPDLIVEPSTFSDSDPAQD